MTFSEVHGQRWMLIVIHQVRYQLNTSQKLFHSRTCGFREKLLNMQ